jgi:hypothetical protein
VAMTATAAPAASFVNLFSNIAFPPFGVGRRPA